MSEPTFELGPDEVKAELQAFPTFSLYSSSPPIVSVESMQMARIPTTSNPTVTGTVTLPPVDAASNDNTAATTSFVRDTLNNKIGALIDSAPTALNTLNEVAAALNDDEKLGATDANLIGTKADASNVYTKTQIDNTNAIINNGQDIDNYNKYIELKTTKLDASANKPMTKVTNLSLIHI